MDRLEMAKALMDTPKATEPGQTVLAYGTATADSANGLVLVDFGGDTVSPDDEQAVEVETTFAVRAGDEVIVSLVGADGTGKTPIVIGVIGRGDEQQTEIDTAVYLATEANVAASVGIITPQHFFYNSQGAFVTSDEVTCDTFNGDGVVTNFTLSGTPYNDTLLALYVAGASVISGYSVSGTVLTFNSAPTGSIVVLWSATQMQDYAKMDSDSFDVVKATDTVASFGREVTVGTRLTGSTVGNYSQVYGNNCTASGNYSHAEGFRTKATGAYSHAEGDQTEASGQQAHAEGNATIAEGIHAHTEGLGTKASGYHSHAEGVKTLASGFGSHAEGNGDGTNLQYGTQATGRGSHAEGMGTLAKSDAQHVQGKYNIEDTSGLYAEIIGNGSAVMIPIPTVTRSNAYNLDWSGNAEFKGEVYVGGCTPNGETPYPVVRYNTAQGRSEYWDGLAWTSVGGGGGSKAILTATILAADWSGPAPYTNAVTVTGLLATDTPVMDLVASSTYATAQNEIADYGNIYKAVCAANTLTVYATSAPTHDLSIQLLCVR